MRERNGWRDDVDERKNERGSFAEMRRNFLRSCRVWRSRCSTATLEKRSPINGHRRFACCNSAHTQSTTFLNPKSPRNCPASKYKSRVEVGCPRRRGRNDFRLFNFQRSRAVSCRCESQATSRCHRPWQGARRMGNGRLYDSNRHQQRRRHRWS